MNNNQKNPDSYKLRNKGGRNPTYHTKQFIERLNEVYNDCLNYSRTAKTLNEEFGTSADDKTIKKLLLDYSSLGQLKEDKKEEDIYKIANKKQKERWERSWNMIDDLLNLYDKAKEEAEESNASNFQKFIKLAPTLLQLEKGIREQLKFIEQQQKEIINNQKTFNYSPVQINQYIKKVKEQEEDKDKKAKEIKLK